MQEEKCDVGAKHGRIGQLYDSAGYGGVDGKSRVGETKLVKVVDVSNTKYKRRQEYNTGRAGFG